MKSTHVFWPASVGENVNETLWLLPNEKRWVWCVGDYGCSTQAALELRTLMANNESEALSPMTTHQPCEDQLNFTAET
jgi:hypothetical protein